MNQCPTCGQKIKPPLDILGDKKILTRFTTKYKINFKTKCWLWQGSVVTAGYGNFCVKQTTYRAHRIAWEIYNGPIPKGLLVCHHCDTKHCVNPNHLYLGTHEENMQDAHDRGLISTPKGEKHSFAKLREVDIKDIRTATGTNVQLAKEYLVSSTSISDVKLRKTWKHIK